MLGFSKKFKNIVGCILTIVFPLIIQAQSITHYPVLEQYRKWSIVAGPVIYNRASITPQYGEYTFKNLPIYGFNAGLEYNFYPELKWSLITGLYTAIEPVYNLNFTIKQFDLYKHYYENLSFQVKMYSLVSFSSPLLLRLNIQTGSKTFISLLTGFKAMYFPQGDAEMVVAISSQELSESREVFGLKLESPENSFQGSFVAGTGFSYAMDKVLLKA
ncbi:MAG TPA: hypothetical protein ENN08_04780, partial [Bacteroidales bacterium]|nr:hypothetical protein [Bacteroidales bacterium]